MNRTLVIAASVVVLGWALAASGQNQAPDANGGTAGGGTAGAVGGAGGNAAGAAATGTAPAAGGAAGTATLQPNAAAGAGTPQPGTSTSGARVRMMFRGRMILNGNLVPAGNTGAGGAGAVASGMIFQGTATLEGTLVPTEGTAGGGALQPGVGGTLSGGGTVSYGAAGTPIFRGPPQARGNGAVPRTFRNTPRYSTPNGAAAPATAPSGSGNQRLYFRGDPGLADGQAGVGPTSGAPTTFGGAGQLGYPPGQGRLNVGGGQFGPMTGGGAPTPYGAAAQLGMQADAAAAQRRSPEMAQGTIPVQGSVAVEGVVEVPASALQTPTGSQGSAGSVAPTQPPELPSPPADVRPREARRPALPERRR